MKRLVFLTSILLLSLRAWMRDPTSLRHPRPLRLSPRAQGDRGVNPKDTRSGTEGSLGRGPLGRAEVVPGPECLRDAPRLSDASGGRERWIAVEDLGDGADTVVGEVIRERRQERTRRLRVAVDLHVRQGERAEKPRPDRALVVRAVPRALVAAVVALVLRVPGSQAAQAVRREEMPGARVDDSPLALLRERARGERHREDLVRPEGVVVSAGPADHVETAPGALVPEPREPRLRPRGQRLPRPRRLSEPTGEPRSEEHTSELQSLAYLVCRLLLEKKNQ